MIWFLFHQVKMKFLRIQDRYQESQKRNMVKLFNISWSYILIYDPWNVLAPTKMIFGPVAEYPLLKLGIVKDITQSIVFNSRRYSRKWELSVCSSNRTGERSKENIRRALPNVWRIMVTKPIFYAKIILVCLSLDIICSSKLAGFLELRSRKLFASWNRECPRINIPVYFYAK